MSDPTREALVAALVSYSGPRDVSLPVHPAAVEARRDGIVALADYLAAALSTTPAPLDEIIEFIDSTLALTPRTGTDDYTGGVTEGMHTALGVVREKVAAIAREYAKP